MECTLQTGAALAMMGVAAPAVGLAGLLCWPAANPSFHSGPPLRGVLRPAGWCFARNDGEGCHREAKGRGDPAG